MAEKKLPKYLTISQAAEYLNTTPNTLRVWEREGKIKPTRTAGNQRRYTVEMLDATLAGKKPTSLASPAKLILGYCRVSSSHQKDDLKRQEAVVTHFCEMQGKSFKIISDIGSGLNYNKKGLKELIHLICTEQCSQVVVNYQDRLVRFGKHNEKTVCPNCGEMDCNISASKNILARATDKEITLYTPYKKVKAILEQRIAS